MTALFALIRRDIRIALRVGGGALIGVLFFLTVVVLMPFAVGPDLALLSRLGPAILWLGALLASLLTLDRLFMADHEDGSLDLITMSRTPLELACASKALAHWLAAGLPLIVATPVLGLLLNLDMVATGAVALTLLAEHPGADVYRHDRRGAGGDAAPRRLADGRPGAAAVDSGPDFRGRGLAGRDRRTHDVRRAVLDPVRAVAGQPRGRPFRGRGEPEAWTGLTLTPINFRSGLSC
ncbi:hypothetical protein ACVWWR_003350 [Bradyrhizobium sp. LM3.2]